MASSWEFRTLKESGISLMDCDHRTPAAVSQGRPYVTIPNMREGRLSLVDARNISETDYQEWTKKALPAVGDVVLSRRCNPGETAVVSEGQEFALGQNLVLLRADKLRTHPSYLRWLVRSPFWWNEVQTYINVGAVFESLRCRDVPLFELPFPPLPIQRKIGDLLDALDHRIALYSNQSLLHEAIARTLFRSWFVDFDPVRAKAEGRAPEGMDAATAALFGSQLRAESDWVIPSGWTLERVTEAITILSGGTPTTSQSDYWDGDVPWFSVADLPRGSQPFVIHTDKKITSAGQASMAGSMVDPNTTILTARGTVGKVALAGKSMTFNQSCYGLKALKFGPFATYFHALAFASELQRRAHGSVFSTITRATLASLSLAVPPPPVAKAFEDLVSPIMDRLLLSAFQIASLTELRDTLLPRLISGKLRIPDAEKLVASAL